MAITVTCPSCGKCAQVPDDARGKKGKCSKCGAVVIVPLVKKKICLVCNVDVAQAKRVKDRQGNYFCEVCWHARAAQSRQPEQKAMTDQLRVLLRFFERISTQFFKMITDTCQRFGTDDGLALGTATQFEIGNYLVARFALTAALFNQHQESLSELVRSLVSAVADLLPGDPSITYPLALERFDLYVQISSDAEAGLALLMDLIVWSSDSQVPASLAEGFVPGLASSCQALNAAVLWADTRYGAMWRLALEKLFSGISNINGLPANEVESRLEAGVKEVERTLRTVKYKNN
jgi:hypothetical protein